MISYHLIYKERQKIKPVNTYEINPHCLNVYMSPDAQRSHILTELGTLPKHVMKSQNCGIVCPFHGDKNPSGNVNLDVMGRNAPLGWFRCWSCGHSCSWNKLAEALNLKKLKSSKEKADDYAKPSNYKANLLGTDEEDEDLGGFEHDLVDIKFKRWKIATWRSFDSRDLKDLGIKFCYHEGKDRYFVFMPVMIEKVLRGYVKAELKKPKKFINFEGDEVKPPAYINAPGSWSKKYGLLFYDYALELAKRKGYKTVVLCEGPRDSLRLLIQFGIPAISVLGALNWNEEKRILLERSGIENIIILMDGDVAGKKATTRIYKDVKNHFNTKYVKLWKREPGSDPFNCSARLLKSIRAQL